MNQSATPRPTNPASPVNAGSVFVELLFAFVPFVILVLGIIQLALLENGKIVSKRAANAAVRAAVVILDDDPRRYGGSPRNSTFPGSPRLREIQRAAIIALAPLDPPVSRQSGSLFAALLVPPASLDLPALLTPTGGSLNRRVRISFVGGTLNPGLHDRITVRLDYDFACRVPVGRAVVCRNGIRHLTSQATLTNQGAPYAY
ncbi:MAG: hypothetical protein QOI66_2986 [Myxococcales bacterium]|jgi:hypothetical protein|nr:hypothetical protein [Myxococcales bacterium]